MKTYINTLSEAAEAVEPVKVDILEDIKDLKLEMYDTVVLQVKKGDYDILEYVVTLVSLTTKVHFAVMLILENEEDYRK